MVRGDRRKKFKGTRDGRNTNRHRNGNVKEPNFRSIFGHQIRKL